MSDIEHRPGNDGKGDSWGFLEDMASIDRLEMVLGDAEASAITPEEMPSEETPDQE